MISISFTIPAWLVILLTVMMGVSAVLELVKLFLQWRNWRAGKRHDAAFRKVVELTRDRRVEGGS